MEEIHYLYKITNKVNGKLYIGMTKDCTLRKRQHLTKTTTSSLVCRAVKKYGKENFSFDILCVGPKDYIADLEIKAIQAYESNAVSGYGYNLAEGGIGGTRPVRSKVKYRKDDNPKFVAGFWFPNKRVALTSLNWTLSKYRYREKNKTLSNLVLNSYEGLYKNKLLDEPCYYRGFWFPSISKACSLYNIHMESLRKDIKMRRFEESLAIQNFSVVRRYLVHGSVYKSLKEASDSLGISEIALRGRYTRKKDPVNYTYTYIKET